jgi:hypothetical protein
MLARMYSTRNFHSLQMGIQNGTATLGDSLAVSYKTKHIPIKGFSYCTPWYLPKWVTSAQEPACDVDSSFTPNCQNLGVIKMFFCSKRKTKFWYTQNNVILVGTKKKTFIKSWKDVKEKTEMHRTKWVNLQRVWTLWFQLPNNLEKAKSWRQ